MISKLNPFPDYPVIRLKEDPKKIHDLTIPTDAILESRSQVKSYVETWLSKSDDPSQKAGSRIVGVRGDFGTGKTHLLLDAAAHFKREFSDSFRDATMILVSCLEVNPIEWFKSAIGPELKQPFLENVVIRLYANAGGNVASKAKLTTAAVKKLSQNPRSIHELIRENLLNATAVDQEFDILLNEVCKDASEEVRQALSGLVWAETVELSERWLAGNSLDKKELRIIKLSENLNTESDAKGVLIALAAIHNYLNIPFCLMIDELEHLTRYDIANESRRNITWLKRLLEGLGDFSALVYISGHWNAWEAQSDYLDRFSLLKPIELIKLNASDVYKIVKARVDNLSPKVFKEKEAEAIAELGNGNIRRILSLCRVIFHETDGFKHSIGIHKIAKLAEQIGQRISIEDATLRIHEILEQYDLSVKRCATIASGIQFDLVGYRGGDPAIVVKLKHAVKQSDLHDYAWHFKDQMKETYKHFPHMIGCFIADGNIDDELISILKSEKQYKILWFDLTERDILSKIRKNLDENLSGSPESQDDMTRFNELRAQNEKLLKQIEAARNGKNLELTKQLEQQQTVLDKQVVELRNQSTERNQELEQKLYKLEQKRSSELDNLYSRLEELTNSMRSKRDAGFTKPTAEEKGEKLHALYTELIKPVSSATKLRLVSKSILSAMILLLAGVTLLLAIPSFDAIMNYRSLGESDFIRYFWLIKYSFALSFFAMGIYMISRNYFNARFTGRKSYRISSTRTLRRSFRGIYFIVGGIAVFFVFFFVDSSFRRMSMLNIIITKYLIPLILFGIAIWIVIQQFNNVDRFMDFRVRFLREIYLRRENPQVLIKADNILKSCLERYGPTEGKSRAILYLEEEFPKIFEYKSYY